MVPLPPDWPAQCSRRRRIFRTGPLCAGLVLLGAGCTEKAEKPLGFVFEDRSRAAGLSDFLHTDGSSGNYFIAETIASGLALFDYDQDGDLDVYFLNGRPLPPTEEGDTRARNALYRNDGNLTFTDVTTETGLEGVGFSVGCAAGDYDQDGDLDLYVAGLESNVLYRNGGKEAGYRFDDVTEEAGCNDTRFSAGAAFLDIDLDGDLDLYVSNYVVEVYKDGKPCIYGSTRGYCAPGLYDPVPDSLFLNLGNGTFRDASEESGIRDHAPRWGLSVISTDVNGDGLPDIYVANDRIDNFLFINKGGGKFEEAGLEMGAAVSADGDEQGSMGIALGDYDRDGHLDMMVTNYQNQTNNLFNSVGADGFRDNALAHGVGEIFLPLVCWGTGFYDFDHDGWLDLFVACGHLEDNVHEYDQSSTYLQQDYVLMNQGDGTFRDETARAGVVFRDWKSSRGAAFGDIDNDGDIDIVVSNSRDRPLLLVNSGGNRRPWIQFDLRGRKNTFAIGARVTVRIGEIPLVKEVSSSGSYASVNDFRVHFGLGDRETVDEVEVRWPSGKKTLLENLPARKLHRIEEPR